MVYCVGRNDFRDFAELCFKEFGDRVKHWITINEPHSYASSGYDGGFVDHMAPGRCSSRAICSQGDSATEPYIAAHHLLLCHATTVKLYKEKYQPIQRGEIGITLNTVWMVPYSSSELDVKAAQRALDFMYGWFLHPLVYGEYPEIMQFLVGSRLPKFTEEQIEMLKGSFDFLGLNYYTGNYAADVPVRSGNISSTTDSMARLSTVDVNGVPIGDPVFSDLKDGNIEHAIEDPQRINFYNRHFWVVREAIKKGVKVKGLFAWSFLDNFEWGAGYDIGFGFFYVDFKNGLRRIPKQSAVWFKNFLNKSEGAALESIRVRSFRLPSPDLSLRTTPVLLESEIQVILIKLPRLPYDDPHKPPILTISNLTKANHPSTSNPSYPDAEYEQFATSVCPFVIADNNYWLSNASFYGGIRCGSLFGTLPSNHTTIQLEYRIQLKLGIIIIRLEASVAIAFQYQFSATVDQEHIFSHFQHKVGNCAPTDLLVYTRIALVLDEIITPYNFIKTCVPTSESLFEAIDGPLEMTDLLFFYNASETVGLIHIDLFLNETIEKCCFHVHMPYLIVIPCFYGKQNPNGLGHGYGRIGFLKIDPKSLSISFCYEPSLEGSNLPVSSKLMFVNLFAPNMFNTFR
ncbi:UNVERIFIED_CONTAM: Beta-glucosidase 13 [Sesamum calycinum]|uniref:Beta-glucosidase 13 n=1 Tax=Sesamum calycinum TaxID=2727403 RepID=A0AAW2IRE6_9LAMI